jgi:hypothetical protein
MVSPSPNSKLRFDLCDAVRYVLLGTVIVAGSDALVVARPIHRDQSIMSARLSRSIHSEQTVTVNISFLDLGEATSKD